MSCPACGTAMSAGLERCPGCGATVAPAVEGALARDPARSRTEPLREIPGLKKKERTWKDEVRERVRDRKRARGQELPLFRDTAEEEEPDAADPSLGGPTLLVAPPLEEDPPPQTRSGGPAAAAASARMELGDDADLPLRPAAAAAVVPAAELRLAEIEPEPVRVAPRVPEHSADDSPAHRLVVLSVAPWSAPPIPASARARPPWTSRCWRPCGPSSSTSRAAPRTWACSD